VGDHADRVRERMAEDGRGPSWQLLDPPARIVLRCILSLDPEVVQPDGFDPSRHEVFAECLVEEF